MPDTTTAEVEIWLAPTEIELVRTALRLLVSILGREQADELAAVQDLLEKLPGG